MMQTLTRADLQAVADRFQEVFTRRDPAAIAALHSPDGIVESPMFATLRGRKAIEDAQRRLAPLLERVPGLLVTEVGAALGISRKFSMPLLDHLDTIRFTRRIKDRRMRAGSLDGHDEGGRKG